MRILQPLESIPAAVEGTLDEAVLVRILADYGLRPDPVYGKRGCGELDRRLAGYNAAAARARWIVLRDLDDGGRCAVTFARQLLPSPSRNMLFRIVVNEIEAWLLADRDSISEFLGVSAELIPAQPETLDDPKLALTGLAARSRSRIIREDIAPRAGSGRSQGPAYAARLAKYVEDSWDPARAEVRAPSLRSFRARLNDFIGRAG